MVVVHGTATVLTKNRSFPIGFIATWQCWDLCHGRPPFSPPQEAAIQPYRAGVHGQSPFPHGFGTLPDHYPKDNVNLYSCEGGDPVLVARGSILSGMAGNVSSENSVPRLKYHGLNIDAGFALVVVSLANYLRPV